MAKLKFEMGRVLDWFSRAGVHSWNLSVRDHGHGHGRMQHHDQGRERDEVMRSLAWAWSENCRGRDIYMRPARFVSGLAASWPVVFFDDVPPEILPAIRYDSLVIETSPGRHHVWQRLSRPATETERKAIQTALVTQMKADPASTSGEHFGRAPGLKNIKRDGCFVTVSREVSTGLLIPVGRILEAAGVTPVPAAPIQEIRPAVPLENRAGDASGAEFGFALARLKWASGTGSRAIYEKSKSKLISQLSERAAVRGKRTTAAACQEYASRTVSAAEAAL